MLISEAEKQDIENAITEAENKTSGEIVTVIAPASEGYYYIPYMWAALIALIVPWPLIYRTWTPVQDIFLIQLAVFAALALILHYPSLRYALVPRSVMRNQAHQFAMQQFFAQDIYTTTGHTGILLFVSVAERFAEIVVDSAIHAKVPEQEWEGIIAKLTANIGSGHAGEGLVEAIRRIGDHLAIHFPPDAAQENPLPNHLVVLDAE